MRITLFLLLLIPFVSFSQKEYAKKILDTLCSEHFDGRGYVNNGDIRAADFIIEELKSIGVQAFKNKPFTQEYQFNVNTFPYPIEVVLGEDTLVPGADYLVNAISGTAQGAFKVIEINKDNYQDVSQGKMNFKMMDPSQTIFAFNFLGTKNKELLKEVTALSYQTTQYFPVITTTASKQMYSVGRQQSNYPLISIDSAAYKTVTSASIKITNKFIPNYTSKNVIGMIPGKKKKKYVVFSAHYDHLGRMGPDAMFPGANDNASGVAMLLSMAKYYMQNEPKYSIVFCFFSGEEAGLLGSKHFVNHPYFPLKKVKYVLNIDIMGGAGDGITLVNATNHMKDYEKMVAINDELKLLDQVKKRGQTQNSDHYFFSEKGVPAFFIYSNGNVKNYHDIYDTAENTALNKFDEVQQLLQAFVAQIK
jgi:aminopeptidase YwaD